MNEYHNDYSFGNLFCGFLLEDTISFSGSDVSVFLPYHPKLIELLSSVALMYALKDSADDLYTAGLWLAYRVLHEKKAQFIEKSILLLTTAIAIKANLHNPKLEELFIRLQSCGEALEVQAG